MRRLAAVPALLVLAGWTLTGCSSWSQLQFKVDDRISIITPANRSTVTVPLRVEWTYDRFNVTGPDGAAARDAGYFAVVIDRAPMPPGEDVRWLFRKDRACSADPDCPTEPYLLERNVYLTESNGIDLKQLPRPERDDGREEHTITVVLLDGTGHRIGESAWHVEVYLDRGQS